MTTLPPWILLTSTAVLFPTPSRTKPMQWQNKSILICGHTSYPTISRDANTLEMHLTVVTSCKIMWLHPSQARLEYFSYWRQAVVYTLNTCFEMVKGFYNRLFRRFFQAITEGPNCIILLEIREYWWKDEMYPSVFSTKTIFSSGIEGRGGSSGSADGVWES